MASFRFQFNHLWFFVGTFSFIRCRITFKSLFVAFLLTFFLVLIEPILIELSRNLLHKIAEILLQCYECRFKLKYTSPVQWISIYPFKHFWQFQSDLISDQSHNFVVVCIIKSIAVVFLIYLFLCIQWHQFKNFCKIFHILN